MADNVKSGPRCVVNENDECPARIEAACLCRQMEHEEYRRARERLASARQCREQA